MCCSGTAEQYNSQDHCRGIIHDTTMVKLFHSGATMNVRRLVLSLSLLAWQLAANLVYGGATGIMVEHYNSVTTGAGDRTSVGGGGGGGSQYASPTKDNAVASALADYLKGYGGVGMNDFGQHEQRDTIESQPGYESNQNRYGSSGGGSDEQQSHISDGYHQPRTYHQTTASESGNSYEVHHQSDIDKFKENDFSHQYEQESGVGDDRGFHDNGGPSLHDYDQSHSGLTQHQHTDVINYVPYPVVKKVHIPYAKPIQIPISNAVIIPIRKPVPIHIPITKQIQVPVERELKIPVERYIPYPVERQVPVPVEKHVPYPVVKYVPVKVPKPYAVKVPVVRTVVHKIKQWW